MFEPGKVQLDWIVASKSCKISTEMLLSCNVVYKDQNLIGNKEHGSMLNPCLVSKQVRSRLALAISQIATS